MDGGGAADGVEDGGVVEEGGEDEGEESLVGVALGMASAARTPGVGPLPFPVCRSLAGVPLPLLLQWWRTCRCVAKDP